MIKSENIDHNFMPVLLIAFFLLAANIKGRSQSFIVQTGANNPLNGVDVGSESTTAFGDLDGDGDWDFISGEGDGVFNYFENTGTATVPVFTQRTGAANPFDGFDVGTRSTPSVIDLDYDGDYDMMSGEYDGFYNYYENTGTSTSPIYVQRTGAANPMDGEDVGRLSSPKFADIDNDGDYDLMSGQYDGDFYYFENTGTAFAPVFTQRTGAANPMNGVNLSYTSRPGFVDVDNDGDWDLFAGEYNPGQVNYFENTGTVASPVYTQRTGAANPMDGINVGFFGRASPAYIDLNNDGFADAMIGETSGVFNYYLGNNVGGTPLPIELTSFIATLQGDNVLVSWVTESEINNDYFSIERSRSIEDFESIGTVKGAGNSKEILEYKFIDKSPLTGYSYYRLKQVDYDGSFSYSDIEVIEYSMNADTYKVFPNPIIGEQIFVQIRGIDAKFVNVEIVNVNGVVLNKYFIEVNTSGIISVPSPQPSGLYFLKINGEGVSANNRIIVK